MDMNTITAGALLGYLRTQAFHLDVTPAGALLVRPAAALGADMHAAITRHKNELIALITGAADGDDADDRGRCRDCYHLQTKGNCAMAALGRLPGVPTWHYPDKNILARCHLFCERTD